MQKLPIEDFFIETETYLRDERLYKKHLETKGPPESCKTMEQANCQVYEPMGNEKQLNTVSHSGKLSPSSNKIKVSVCSGCKGTEHNFKSCIRRMRECRVGAF